MEPVLRIEAVVAHAADNFAIGNSVTNTLPFRLPSDLRRFKEITEGCPVLMGRRTAESIGRALPKRYNLVLSRHGKVPYHGQVSVASPEEAIYRALEWCRANEKPPVLFVIGGQDVYELMIPYLTGVHLTVVNQSLAQDDRYWPAKLLDLAVESGVLGQPVTEAEADGEDHGITYKYTYLQYPLTPNNPLAELRTIVPMYWDAACTDVSSRQFFAIQRAMPQPGFAEQFLHLRLGVEEMRNRWPGFTGYKGGPGYRGFNGPGQVETLQIGHGFGSRGRSFELPPIGFTRTAGMQRANDWNVPARYPDPGELLIEISGEPGLGKTSLLAYIGRCLDRLFQQQDRLVSIKVVERDGVWPSIIRDVVEDGMDKFQAPKLSQVTLVSMHRVAAIPQPGPDDAAYNGSLYPEDVEIPDHKLTAKQLSQRYSETGEHPRYTCEIWKQQVTVDGILLGYWEWVLYMITTDVIREEAMTSAAPKA